MSAPACRDGYGKRLRAGDTVEMAGTNSSDAGYDIGTVVSVDDGRVTVRWELARVSYDEAPHALVRVDSKEDES